MSRLDFLARLRRWIATRPGRLVLAGVTGFSAVVLTTIVPNEASAQAPSAVAPAPAAPAAPAPPATTGLTFPTQHPPAESAATAANPHAGGHADPHAPGAPHAAPHGSASAHGEAHGGSYHAPSDFNFADHARYTAEREKAARGEKDAHGNPIVPVTPFAYLLLNAAILFFIYYRAGKKPIADGLQARHDTVAKDLAESAKIKAEAEARLAEYTTRLETLEEELQRIKGDIIKAGEGERARIVKEAEEKAERMKKDATFLLDQEMKQLRLDMIAFTVEAASTAAEQVLKSRIGASDHERLADEYVKQLSQSPPSQSLGASPARPSGGAS